MATQAWASRFAPRGADSTVLFVSLSLCPAPSRPRTPQAVEQALRHSFDHVAGPGAVRSVEVLQCRGVGSAAAASRQSSLYSSESWCAKVTLCDHDDAACAVGRCHSPRPLQLYSKDTAGSSSTSLGPLIVEWWLESARVTVVNVPVSATEAEVAKAFSQWGEFPDAPFSRHASAGVRGGSASIASGAASSAGRVGTTTIARAAAADEADGEETSGFEAVILERNAESGTSKGIAHVFYRHRRYASLAVRLLSENHFLMCGSPRPLLAMHGEAFERMVREELSGEAQPSTSTWLLTATPNPLSLSSVSPAAVQQRQQGQEGQLEHDFFICSMAQPHFVQRLTLEGELAVNWRMVRESYLHAFSYMGRHHRQQQMLEWARNIATYLATVETLSEEEKRSNQLTAGDRKGKGRGGRARPSREIRALQRQLRRLQRRLERARAGSSKSKAKVQQGATMKPIPLRNAVSKDVQFDDRFEFKFDDVQQFPPHEPAAANSAHDMDRADEEGWDQHDFLASSMAPDGVCSCALFVGSIPCSAEPAAVASELEARLCGGAVVKSVSVVVDGEPELAPAAPAGGTLSSGDASPATTGRDGASEHKRRRVRYEHETRDEKATASEARRASSSRSHYCAKVVMRSHRDAVRAVAAGELKLRGQCLFVQWWLDSPRLSVLNVPPSCSDEELRRVFSVWGALGSGSAAVSIERDPDSNMSRGVAMVMYRHRRTAAAVVRLLRERQFVLPGSPRPLLALSYSALERLRQFVHVPHADDELRAGRGDDQQSSSEDDGSSADDNAGDSWLAKACNASNRRQGDWICPSCSFHNFSARLHCMKCHTAKPSSGDTHNESDTHDGAAADTDIAAASGDSGRGKRSADDISFILCHAAVPHIASPATLEFVMAGRWRMLRQRQMAEREHLVRQLSKQCAAMWRLCFRKYKEKRDSMTPDMRDRHEQNLARYRTTIGLPV